MMPLLDKLFPSRKSFRNSLESFVASNVGTQEDDRDSALQLGTDQVRILLFRECEWRGRKLLFDSVTLEKHRCKNKAPTCQSKAKDDRKKEGPISFATGRDYEQERSAEDDVSLLSEMVFGTVAMTYRGSSFKIHSMNSPPCIMCTKIFPATEHNTRKQNERVSDEGLGRSVNLDSNSSVRTLLSRPSSGNLSGADLSHGPRKSSTCSSNGSGWDIDIPPPMGSSQSLESNGSSGIGSLSSLRRRWLRAVSTSLGRSESDDAFGMQHWGESGSDSREGHVKRHKTRLGLTMLVRLNEGHERKIETRLLEHMALVEGMLDRLRYSCIEASSGQSSYRGGMQLSERLYRSSSRFVVSLLRLLMNVNSCANSRTPLLWHDVLLNSARIERKTSVLHHTLQQMCQLLDEIDTKSTNFFLSTVVTAVLTYHLGWIYTALPSHDRQLMEKLGSWYPCNPLWAQLGDLYGALGSPVRIAHTVIAGDPKKVELINSVLSFLSYFVRSGIVKKRLEHRVSAEEDVLEATGVLEQARIKRPYLFSQPKPNASCDRDVSASRSSFRKQIPARPRSYDLAGCDTATERSCPQFPVGRTRSERSVSPLKRSATMKSNLDAFTLKPEEFEADAKVASKLPLLEAQNVGRGINRDVDREVSRDNNVTANGTEFEGCEKYIFSEDKNCASKVKIIVSEEADDQKPEPRDSPQFALRNFEKKLEDGVGQETFNVGKMDYLGGRDNTCVDTLKLYTEPSDLETRQSVASENKDTQVFFTLGEEEKLPKSLSRSRLGYNCQCSYTFTRVPSTSAQLPEGVLRKIIQRNFPESSKSIQPPPGTASGMAPRSIGFCQKCNGQGYAPPQSYDGSKQVLETPTNATEVLRTCGNTVGDGTVGLSRSSSLEALMEANSVVELPMPRTKKAEKSGTGQETGFTKTLLQSRITNDEQNATNAFDASYTWGLVLQGLMKKRRKKKKRKVVRQDENDDANEVEAEKEWWYCMRDECLASVRFPSIDQPVAESLCILADLDTWHVGILSNNTPSQASPLPVGMSRLVANMLEAFAYVWRKYRSPSHCVGILESKLKEMWLRSEALAEMLMAAELCDASVGNLTSALDLDAADIPLLLAVATSYSPEIAQRFGLTLT